MQRLGTTSTEALFLLPMNLAETPAVLSQFRLSHRSETSSHFINAIGAKARKYFMPPTWFDITDEFHANEDLFEWIDLLESVTLANSRFTMLDLGAGYGRWIVNGAMACRQKGKDFFLAGVEAEDIHYRWMLEHLLDNSISSQQYSAVHGPISSVEKDVFFTFGHASEWYGQAILPSEDASFGNWRKSAVRQRRAVSIIDLLNQVGPLDALHSDVQGEEALIFPACIDLLDESSKRVHIGTHSREIDEILFSLFTKHRWESHFVFPSQTKAVMTPYGRIDFTDGVQSWINPRL